MMQRDFILAVKTQQTAARNDRLGAARAQSELEIPANNEFGRWLGALSKQPDIIKTRFVQLDKHVGIDGADFFPAVNPLKWVDEFAVSCIKRGQLIDIGGILGAGIRLVRDRPGAAAVWALINILFVGATQVAMLPMMQGLSAARAGAAEPGVMFTAMGPFYGVILVIMIAQIVLWAAVYRACLRPEESAAAYLRIGGDELRLFVIGLLWAVFSFAILMIGGLIIYVGFVASDLGRASSTASAITTIFGMLGFFLIAFVLFVFLGVRLALVWPLAVQRKRIMIAEAWRLSRGHFWAMFGSAVVVLVGPEGDDPLLAQVLVDRDVGVVHVHQL